MGVSKGSGNLKRDLNHMAPAANNAKLGDRLDDLITQHNILIAKFNSLMTALGAGGSTVPTLTTTQALTSPVAIQTLATLPTPEITGDRP
jgi:hypothetical protein